MNHNSRQLDFDANDGSQHQNDGAWKLWVGLFRR